MYVKHKMEVTHPMTKVQAIRWLKSSPRLISWANDPEKVSWITEEYKSLAVNTHKLGVYTPKYPLEDGLINAHNHLTVPCEAYHEFESGSEYGVCDGVKNFLEVFDEELKSIKERVFVLLTPIYRECQPECSGWRWHKWGPYIGSYKQQHEYLYDEDIDVVWLYHIYAVKD